MKLILEAIKSLFRKIEAQRTHWVEQREVVVIPETTVTIDEDGDYETLSEECPQLIVGEKYIVLLNGVRYECIARAWNEEDCVLIGNGTIYGDDNPGNNEPFSSDSYESGTIYLNVATSGEYTVAIYKQETVVHPLDEKFLPEGVPYGSLTPVSQAEGTVVNANPCAYFKVADAIDFDIEKLNYVSLNAIFENGYSMTIESGVTVGVSEQYGGWRIYRTIGLNSEVIGAYLPDDESAFKWWNEIWGEGEAYTAGLYFRTYDEDLYGGQTFNCSYAFLIEDYRKINKALLPNEIYDMIENAKGTANNAQVLADGKMDKNNPVGTGSFSMNRLAGTTVGTHSFAEGYRGTASGAYSHAEGNSTTSSGGSSHSEGYGTNATGAFTHAEGQKTVAANKAQHVQGEFNIADNTGSNTTRGKYAHIVGNGTSDDNRSNAHTLDWNGLGWFKGGLKIGGTSQDDANAKEVALKEDIPTDDHINNLINTALGVIENGTY